MDRDICSKGKSTALGLPAVVACGYRRVRSTKSGLTFPAFLVALPRAAATTTTTASHDDDDDDDNDNDNNNAAKDGPSPPPRLVWRSKKDFLLLGRKSSAVLPKAALKKLAAEKQQHSEGGDNKDRPSCPWKRPQSTIEIRQQLEADFSSTAPDFYRDNMKKSIYQLDTFLQSAQKESLGLVVDSGGSDSTGSMASSAWDVFSRPEDTEGLLITSNPSLPSGIMVGARPTTTTTSRERSSQLGQYFASRENAKKVIRGALAKLNLLLLDNNRARNRQAPTSRTHLVFVEPSCGHGDILLALLDALNDDDDSNHSKQWNNDHTTISMFGYDIDSNAVETCKDRVESYAQSQDTNRYRMQFVCQDFLTTTRQTNPANSVPPCGSCTTLVCCIGGPPYTSGAGSHSINSDDKGGSIQRDLPTRFVQHCQVEWDADIVSFLMPKRYRQVDWRLESPPTNQVEGKQWVCQTEELESSTFHFQGTMPVTQPSIIQTLSCM